MAQNPGAALLVAVTHAVRAATKDKPVYQPNGGSPTWWPIIAQVLRYIDPAETAKPDNLADRHRRLKGKLSVEALDAMAASVDPETYREAIRHVLEHGGAPAGAPPVLPGVNAPARLEGPDPRAQATKKEWAPPPSRSDDPDERVQERKEEILRQHDRKVAKQLTDQRALTEMLVDAITEGVKAAPPIVVRSVPEIIFKGPVDEEVPVVLLSDIHGGTLILPEEVGGLGEFNMQVFRKRLNTYQNNICTTIDLHRKAAKIKKLVIKILGDTVEGEVIFDGQAYRIELVVTDQLFEVASYLIAWILGILATGLVEEIHIICIYGNHGRTTHKKGASKGHSNWDYVLYKHMQAVLANEPRIKWFIPKAWFALVDIMGWKIYCSHGDEVKSWNGIPFYGIMRHDMRTTTLLQSVGQGYYGMVSGDKHVSATIPRVWGFQVMNGSIVGGSDFSMHLLGTASEPMQTMFGINERIGKHWQYDFVLDRRDPEEIGKHLALTSI